MRIHKFVFSFFCSISLFVISSCSDSTDDIITNEDGVDDDTEVVIDDDFETNSRDSVFSNAVTITFSDNTAIITNPYENDGVSIIQSDGNVVVTSTNLVIEINYVLSGSIQNGSFKIYSDYKFGLMMNGVDITSSDGPALNVQSGKKVTVTLVNGTNSRLIDSNTYTA